MGRGLTSFLNDVWISNVGGAKWIELIASAPWGPRGAFGFVSIAEKLFVFGGTNNTNGQDMTTTLQYNDCQNGTHSIQQPCNRSAVAPHWQTRHSHSVVWSVLDAAAHLHSCLLLLVSVSLSVWSSLDYGRSARTLTPQTAIGSAPSVCPCLCSRR